MNAIILQASLKRTGPTNTQTLAEFFADKLQQKGIDVEIVRLAQHTILPGTHTDLGDDWPSIFKRIESADIVIFATPIWWGTHSSELQKVIERLDEVHDEILEGKESRLAGKVGGVLITGDSDGGEHVIGNVANFFNAIGIVFPPYASLSVLWEGHKKGAGTPREELMAKYEKDYARTAETMIESLTRYTSRHA